MNNTQPPKKGANIILGTVLIGLGGLFLLTQLFNISLIGFFWPFFVIIPGLLFFVGMALGGKQLGPLAIPGSIVTMVGLLLFYQNTFNHWESWAYAWTLIMPTSIGIGMMINGAWSGVNKLIKVGLRFAGVGMAMFLAGGFVFEVIFNISGSRITGLLWPLALIGLGVYLLSRQRDEGEPQRLPDGKINEFAGMTPPPERTPIQPEPTQPQQTEFRPLDLDRGE